ncbi:MAG: DUF6513 domain-containing protein [Gemmataceae bacterium]
MTPRLLFVTGRLAEPALRRTLAEVEPVAGFAYDVAVLPITVVALATTPWIARHLSVPAGVDRVVLPGLCRGDLAAMAAATAAPVERGPADLRDLPDYLIGKATTRGDYGAHDIAILAEINHAPQLACQELLRQARSLRDEGADVIDVGCDPGSTWSGVGDAVRALRDEGLRVSIDSFDGEEVERAVRAGAELVLSVNSSNVDAPPTGASRSSPCPTCRQRWRGWMRPSRSSWRAACRSASTRSWSRSPSASPRRWDATWKCGGATPGLR